MIYWGLENHVRAEVVVRDNWLCLKRMERKKTHNLCEVAGVGGAEASACGKMTQVMLNLREKEKSFGIGGVALWWHGIFPLMGGWIFTRNIHSKTHYIGNDHETEKDFHKF